MKNGDEPCAVRCGTGTASPQLIVVWSSLFLQALALDARPPVASGGDTGARRGTAQARGRLAGTRRRRCAWTGARQRAAAARIRTAAATGTCGGGGAGATPPAAASAACGAAPG